MIKSIVVDDNPIICRALIDTIDWNSLNCEVVGEAADGENAIELLKVEDVDIVITDIKMPKVDGLKLTEYIKKEYPEIKVIIITGYDDLEDFLSLQETTIVAFKSEQIEILEEISVKW